MKEGKKKKKEKASPKGLKCGQHRYVVSLLVLRSFPTSQKKHFVGGLDTVETCKMLSYWTDKSKICINEACKTALSCVFDFYKYYGHVGGRLLLAEFPSVQQTPDVYVKCLMREPRTQSQMHVVLFCAGRLFHVAEVVLEPWYRSH